jgi:hypothetical protein
MMRIPLAKTAYRHVRRLGALGIKPFDGALSRPIADLRRRVEVDQVALARIIVIALHRDAFARDHGNADAEGRCLIAVGESGAGRERDAPRAPFRAGALGIGDALDGPRGVLGLGGHMDQRFGVEDMAVIGVEIGRRAFQKKLGIGEAAIRIVRRDLCHGNRAVDQCFQRGLGMIGRRYNRLLLADDDAQTQIAGFRPVDVLKLAQAIGDAE